MLARATVAVILLASTSFIAATARRLPGAAAVLGRPVPSLRTIGDRFSLPVERLAVAPRPVAAASGRPTRASTGGATKLVGAAAGASAWRHRRGLARWQGGSRSSVRRTAAAETDAPRKLNERQEQFWEMLEEKFEDDVVAEFGRDSLTRVYEYMKYMKYEKDVPELPHLQDIDQEYFPGLRAKPFWSISEIGGDWIEKMNAGLPYVQGELADLLEEAEADMIADSVKNAVMGAGWTGFRLQRLGEWLQKNVARFPETVQLIQEAGVPLAMRGVIVARQVPNSGVAPHSDGRNIFLTAHFGLSIPEDCDITVGGQTKKWEEDGAIVFDASFIHSTRNDADEDRFVLIVDFWHPDLTEPEREALEYIYDFRNKFEQGKIKYRQKMPEGFWETLQMYSAWGGAYTEEKGARQQDAGPDSIGGFMM